MKIHKFKKDLLGGLCIECELPQNHPAHIRKEDEPGEYIYDWQRDESRSNKALAAAVFFVTWQHEPREVQADGLIAILDALLDTMDEDEADEFFESLFTKKKPSKKKYEQSNRNRNF